MTSFLKKTFLIIAILVLATDALAFQFNIDPPRNELVIKPGEQKNAFIKLNNTQSDQQMHVKVYYQDIAYLPDGSNDFLPPTSTPWSACSWFQIRPSEFDLLPREEKIVTVTVSVPREARGGGYSIIFFETLVPAKEKTESSTRMNVRLGSFILVTVDGTEEYKAKLQNISVSRDEKDKHSVIQVTIQNEGNVLIRPQGTVKLLDKVGEEVKLLTLNEARSGVFPGTSRAFMVKVEDNVPAGTYKAETVIDFGGDFLIAGEKNLNL